LFIFAKSNKFEAFKKGIYMEFTFFKGVALLYTVLILFGTMIVSNFIVTAMIILLKENIIANPESSVLPNFLKKENGFLFKMNKLPETDEDIIEKKVLFSAK
jgi:hypothetical protein